MSQATTRGIRISVESRASTEHTHPDAGRWLFLYRVEIANESEETVQLLQRHWVITDGEGRVQEVRGAGVVGEQPVLAPGESFTYTSSCPLPTPHGTMEGSYTFTLESGETFEARIAPFILSGPGTVH